MERKEVLISDLAQAFEPKELLTNTSQMGKWNIVEYKNSSFSGTLLDSRRSNDSGTITLDPKLEGWYKINIIIPCFPSPTNYLKLSNEDTYTYFAGLRNGYMNMEECFWRCADLTGVSINLTKDNVRSHINSCVAAFRFIPMSDEEVAAYKAQKEDPDTKRLYYCDDMNNHPQWMTMHKPEDWNCALTYLEDSDTEWFSPEISDFDFWKDEGNSPSRYSPDKSYTDADVFKAISKRAHEIGVKISPCIRMGLWGLSFPHHYGSTGNKFNDEHRSMACVDRNGDVTSAPSYAYPEVRKYVIDQLVSSAKCGADAVALAACRGVPFILFEKPVVDEFLAKYGEDPRELPLDDPRLNAIHCQIMSRLFSELRSALDEACGKNKVGIHLVGMNSVEDNKYVGFDVEALAKEGLIDAVVTHPRRFIEFVPDHIRKNDDQNKIDIEKYNKYIRDEMSATMLYDGACDTPSTNSRGEKLGPDSLVNNVEQWNEFSNKYGIRTYIDISHFSDSRFGCSNNGALLNRAVELFKHGMNGVGIWNGPCFSTNTVSWDLISKLGHVKDFLSLAPHPNGRNMYRVITYGNCNINRYKPIWGG